MNPRILSRADLVNFGRNAAAAIAGGKVSGFSPAQAAELTDAILAATDTLDEADKQAVASVAKARTDVEIAQKGRLALLELMSGGKFGMRGVNSTAAEYEAVGFDPPADPSNITKPETPTKLSAVGYSNGVNVLKYKGNNVPGKVSYIVEAKKNGEADWVMIGTAQKQSFRHEGVTPGQPYQYRVRAQATRGLVSAWSNTAAVYDPQAK